MIFETSDPLALAGVLLASLLVLAKSAQVINDQAMVLARFFKISELAIGFLLLSVATSLPELTIAVMAGLKHESGISVGNVLGANISNLTLVLGISALFATVTFGKKETRKLTNILLLASAIPIAILFLNYGSAASPVLKSLFAVLNGLIGVCLLTAFGAYAYVVLKERIAEKYGEKIGAEKAVVSAFVFSIALAVLVASSNAVVDSAVQLAQLLGVAKAVMGATIISIGTTLPELTVTALAVRGKHKEMGIGNAVGSCIVNLTLILGAGAVLNPLAADLTAFTTLVVFFLAANFLLWHIVRKYRVLGKRQAVLLLGFYAAFLLLASKIGAPA